jgi:hypothetical protein
VIAQRQYRQIVTQKVSPIWDELSHCDPDRAEAIEELAQRDCHFRVICENYGEAIQAARYWAAGQDRTSNKADEFNQLAEELKHEAFSYLEQVAEK